ncbi:EAL domain-containing protein [Agarilytica rhodophyticola]|uniref:EAL domain-containing protein n=1 Tax=Agarilytica rhodophyticola TaxID=1737490 RepID=UPI000B344996|nr:EAL domain-containing protein [Agarilytica rhodophyticola]
MSSYSFKWNSVQARLLRTILFSFTVGVIVAGSILFAVVNNMSRTEMVENLSSTGSVLAENLSRSMAMLDVHGAQASLAFVANSQKIDLLCLYNKKGLLFSGYVNSSSSERCQEKVDPAVHFQYLEIHDDIVFYIPVVEKKVAKNSVFNSAALVGQPSLGRVLGHLYVQTNTSVLAKAQWMFTLFLVFALIVSLCVASFLVKFLMRRSLLPLNTLFQLSKVIAKNPFSEERIKKVHDDEVGNVIDVFNTVLDNLAQENKALAFSESRFRTLSENAPIGVFFKTELGEYQYINTHWSHITGLDLVTVDVFVSHIDEVDRKRYQYAMSTILGNKIAQALEYRFVHPQRGERIFIEYISFVPDNSNGQRFIGTLLDVTELKLAQGEIEKLAYYDSLTKLPNRKFLLDKLDALIATAEKENTCIAMYMTNFDEFKKVNDSLNHDIGDQLLIDTAKQLQKNFRTNNMMARMGGDEFVLLVQDSQQPGQLKKTANYVLDALRSTIHEGNNFLQVTGSVGVSVFPIDASTPEELIRCAGMALHDAKKSGGNQISYYSKDLGHKMTERLRLEQKLRQVVIEKKLDVYIQPQYIAGTKDIYWGEALVRWCDSEQGYISPDVFIPIAEDLGLISDIENFVLDSILGLLSNKMEALSKLGIRGISVNLSAKQFFSPNFIDLIREKFRFYDVSPKLIEFELTETTVMDDIDKAIIVMESMRQLGCHLSIDDFGTGYSSLSYLKRFPITSVKIDKSFIKDIPNDQNDVKISCAIIAMAHNLGLSVVAEGVENETQANLLASYNCEFLQGYFLDKPLSIAELLERAEYSMALEVNA